MPIIISAATAMLCFFKSLIYELIAIKRTNSAVIATLQQSHEGLPKSIFFSQALLMSINTTDIRRPLGRPRLRWIDVVKKDLQCINLSLLDAVQSASDRAAWLEIF